MEPKKVKNIVSPGPFVPCLLRYNRQFIPCGVQVHWISLLLLVAKIIGVLKDYPYSKNITNFVVTHPLFCTIGGHNHHVIVFLFHRKYITGGISKIIVQFLHYHNCLIVESIFYIVIINIVWPVIHSLDYSGSIDTLIFNIHQPLKDTETIIQQ